MNEKSTKASTEVLQKFATSTAAWRVILRLLPRGKACSLQRLNRRMCKYSFLTASDERIVPQVVTAATVDPLLQKVRRSFEDLLDEVPTARKESVMLALNRFFVQEPPQRLVAYKTQVIDRSSTEAYDRLALFWANGHMVTVDVMRKIVPTYGQLHQPLFWVLEQYNAAKDVRRRR